MSILNDLPFSQQSGLAVLGYGITSIDGVQSVCALLKKEDLHSKDHQCLFRSLQEMYEKGMPLDIYLDIYLLCEELKRQKRVRGLGEKNPQPGKVFTGLKPAPETLEKFKPFSPLGAMLSHDFPLHSNIASCEAVPSGRASFSSYSVRYYIFFKDTFLVGNCEERIGRKVLIDLKTFDASALKLTIG